MKSENNNEIINSNKDESEKLIELIEGHIYSDIKTINKYINGKSISEEEDERENNNLDNCIIENDKNENLLNKNINGKNMNSNENNNINLMDVENSNNVEEYDFDIGCNINNKGNNLSYDINNNLEDMINVLNNLKIRNKDIESKKTHNNIDIIEEYIHKEFLKPLKERINKKNSLNLTLAKNKYKNKIKKPILYPKEENKKKGISFPKEAKKRKHNCSSDSQSSYNLKRKI